jgi:hypothetical protein
LVKDASGIYHDEARLCGTMDGRPTDKPPEMITLAVVADRLHYHGSDRERSVRRLFTEMASS